MPYLELKNIVKKFGEFYAVKDFNLSVKEGELVALLGSSGCGKTTTLRMIAGFTHPTSGEISVGGKIINRIPPYRRNIGIVFQNYALFPHLTTFENVAFGLKLKKFSASQIKSKVEKALELVRLKGLEDRLPRELSGGQQQRVALARALVMEPTVLLLDEPLSNLDARLRGQMQVEIKRIQREIGITTILVTHDQEEAMSLADQIVVMKEGTIQQIGTPRQIFETPKNTFVADFMGFSNFLKGIVKDMGTKDSAVAVEVGKDVILSACKCPDKFKAGDEVILAIRPESIVVDAEDKSNNTWTARVAGSSYKGSVTRLVLKDALGTTLYIDVTDHHTIAVGDKIKFYIPPEKVMVYQN